MVGMVVWLAVLVGTSLTAAQPTALHPAFRDAGRRPGLQIWRVVNFVPEPVEPKDYGKFFEGDSYILLSTKEEAGKKGSYVWDIFYWLGSKTSQDESGAAAILAVSLDDGLGGGPVQHREEQAHESGQFMALFKQGGVRYVAGGAPSGFHHVEVNAAGEKRLYQVKGKRNVRVTQVAPEAKSMNKGDCFILDSGRDIYVWVGNKAKGQERVKAIGAANLIRDQDHAGRGKVAVLDGSSSPEELQKFFAELGSGTASQVANEPSVDDDQDFEKKIEGLVALHKVSDANGKLVSQRISTKPLTKALLDPNDCFVLDTVTSGIFVWIGRKSSSQEKVRALQMGQAFLADNNYPKWTRMRRVVEGSEPAAFREYFAAWSDARRTG